MTPLERLGREAHGALSGDVTPEVDAASRKRLVAAIALPRARRQFGGWLVAAAMVAVGGLGAGVFYARGRAPVAAVEAGFRVEGGVVAENQWIRAGDAPAKLLFREGSTVVLASRASARVIGTSPHGAELLVESGSAHVRVEHREGTQWAVRAGPYTLRVTGTEFDVAWEPASEVLRVDLQSGGLEIVGPSPGGMVRLGAGQALEASPDGLSVRSLASAAQAAPSAVPSASASVALVPVARASPSAADLPASWSRLVATGSYKLVLDDADARGVDGMLGTAGPSDLLALADAARYGRRGELATRALGALRKRFPASREAGVATFLLARAADDAGKTADAIQLFDAYLATGGSFGAEALGRKMLALQRAGRAGDALAAAKQYLARHPKGSHAKLARELSGEE